MLKDMPIPPGSETCHEAASSGSSQMEDSRAVAETTTQQNSTTDELTMDVAGRERRIQKFDSTAHQTTNNDENVDGGVTNG